MTLDLTYEQLHLINDAFVIHRSELWQEINKVNNKFKDDPGMSEEKAKYWAQVQDNLYKKMDSFDEIKRKINELL